MNVSALILPVSQYAYAVRKFKKLDKPINWLYFGKDSSSVYSIEKELPAYFERIQIGKLHNIVADRIRKGFVDWLDQLNDLYAVDREWWFESISCRNIYESSLFQNCCYVEIIKELFSQNYLDRPCIIFVDSEGLADVLSVWLIGKKIKAVFYRKFYLNKKVRMSLLSLWDYCFFLCQLISRLIAALLTRAHRRQIKTAPVTPQVLIDTFIHLNSFRGDGSFYDPYYPGLFEFFQSRGYNIIFHPVLDISQLDFYSIYKQMRGSNHNFLIPEDYLRLTDYFSIIFYPFRFHRRKIKASPFLGVDVSPLIKEERSSPYFSGPMLADLIYRLFGRLKHRYPAPEIIIDWYENQVIDRAFILGSRLAFPDAKLIGAQLFLHSSNFLNHFPTKTEIKYKLVPDLVLCTSQMQCEMAKLFTDKFRCLPCAALRYSHIYDHLVETDRSSIEKNILVLLPYIHDEAFELLILVKEALKMFSQNIQIRIKSHPFLDMKSFGLKFGKLPGQICDKTLKEEFSQALVVVGTNSSSLVEALARAIPVVFVARQNCFSQNPLADIPDGIARMCYSSLELAEALAHYYSLPLSERSGFKSESLRIRNLYFTPVSKETLEPFLGKEGRNECIINTP